MNWYCNHCQEYVDLDQEYVSATGSITISFPPDCPVCGSQLVQKW